MELKITTMPIGDITPYEKNAKLHPQYQIDQIMESIEQFGMNDPIAIWGERNTVVEGHGRLEACKALGMTEVPVIRLDHLSDVQRKAYTLAHNKLTMNSDFDLEILKQELDGLWDEIDMSFFGFEYPEEEEEAPKDDGYAGVLPVEPISKQGQTWILGDHTLYIGDATDPESWEKLMGEEEADLLMTDPPYNVAYENSQGMTIDNDDMGDESFEEFLTEAFENACRHMADGAGFYCWYASRNAVQFLNALKAAGLSMRQQLIWVKNSFNLGRQDYQLQHEPCWYGWKDTGSHYFTDRRDQATVFDDIDLETITKKEAVEFIQLLRQTVMSTDVSYEQKPKADDMHPTMKPVPLIGRMIINSTEKGDTVLDCFGGSGSTLIAAEELGRKCRIMELDPRYADVIIDRWETLTGERATLQED